MKIRVALFIIGIFLMGLGIAMITSIRLGTTPISTIPYVISHTLPWSFGVWTFLLGIVFILIQMALLKTVMDRRVYGQLLISPLLGIAIDLGMWLVHGYEPGLFLGKIAFLVMGCFVLAFGIYLQLEANLIMNAGESIVQVISEKVGKPFSTMKIWFDWTLVSLAVVIGLISLQSPVGIGIGTLISAFLVGYNLKLMNWLRTRMSFTLLKRE